MADKPPTKRTGPKRAPQDTEQLLCAMLMLKGLPSGAADWEKVASRMPARPDGSGEKPNPEAVRGMWRRLKAKWEEEGIWSNDNDDGSPNPKILKAPKAPKVKVEGKGKGRAKAPKFKGGKKTETKVVESDAEDEFAAEGSGTRRDVELDSDA